MSLQTQLKGWVKYLTPETSFMIALRRGGAKASVKNRESCCPVNLYFENYPRMLGTDMMCHWSL